MIFFIILIAIFLITKHLWAWDIDISEIEKNRWQIMGFWTHTSTNKFGMKCKERKFKILFKTN